MILVYSFLITLFTSAALIGPGVYLAQVRRWPDENIFMFYLGYFVFVFLWAMIFAVMYKG